LSDITLEHQPAIAEAFAKSLETLAKDNISTIVALGRCIFNRKDIMPLLPKLNMPTLILVGEFDKPRPPHEAKKMADLITSAQCKIVPNAGHISALEQPKEVNKLLHAFLKN
jgi:pimeloyl-ACP methyl ester carboxylesterase